MAPNRKFLTGGALAALAVLFVAAILISNALVRNARIDLTENKLYTLSQGTKDVLATIDDPINVYFFYSDRGSRDLPQMRNYAQRVRDLLEEVVARSNGKVKLEVIDPQPFSEDEDRATAYGLSPLPHGPGGENLFFGLVGTNSTSRKSVMPFIAPDKEQFLEYDFAKMIYELSVPKKRVVGMISGLPLVTGFDPMARQMLREPWAMEPQLKQLFDVRELNPAQLKSIDPDINVLVVAHPKSLPEDAQYAIDQFVMRGGRVLLFLDPHAETDDGGANANDPRMSIIADKSSDLPKLLKAWGIEYDSHQALLDRGHALLVAGADARPIRAVSMLGFSKRDLNSDDVVTTYLERINVSSPGTFRLAKDSKSKLVPVLQTGNEAMLVPIERVKFATEPGQLLANYQPDNERHVIAGRLQGTFTTAFPERKGATHLAEAKQEGEIFIVADTDVLSNRMWLQQGRSGGVQAFANNGDFFINAIDYLSGSSAMMSIRGRAVSQRPFTRVDDMKRDAEASFRGKERELQQQLSGLERRLTEMQSGKGKQGEPILSAEQQRELQAFMQKKVEIRKELRQVRRGLDEQIDALGTRLKFLNIGLMPLLITLAALAFAWWRRGQRTAARSAAQ